MDDFVQDTADMERDLSRRSRLLPAGIALILLAAFGAVVWFAFLEPSVAPDDEQTVELIQADPEPVKSKPEDPGGMEVEHQDKLILNPDPEKPQVERLLPPPEDPLPIPQQESGVEAAENAQESAPEAQAAESTSPAVTNGPSSLLKEPEAAAGAAETQETAEVPDAAGQQPTGPSTAEAGDAEVAEEPAAAESKPEKAPEPQQAEAVEQAAPATEPEPTTPKPKPSKTAQAPAEAPAQRKQTAQIPTDSGYVLQLASLRSEALALQEWGRIQNGNKNLLAQLRPIVEKADIEGIGTRYRLQTGPFPTKETAQDLCSQLKAAKQDCLVKRRN